MRAVNSGVCLSTRVSLLGHRYITFWDVLLHRNCDKFNLCSGTCLGFSTIISSIAEQTMLFYVCSIRLIWYKAPSVHTRPQHLFQLSCSISFQFRAFSLWVEIVRYIVVFFLLIVCLVTQASGLFKAGGSFIGLAPMFDELVEHMIDTQGPGNVRRRSSCR